MGKDKDMKHVVVVLGLDLFVVNFALIHGLGVALSLGCWTFHADQNIQGHCTVRVMIGGSCSSSGFFT